MHLLASLLLLAFVIGRELRKRRRPARARARPGELISDPRPRPRDLIPDAYPEPPHKIT